MRSKVTITALVCLSLTLALSSAAFSQGAKFSDLIEAKSSLCYPLEFSFKRPAGVLKTAFPGVKFSHGQHGSIGCVKCHHMWDGTSEVQACNTAGCHDNLTERQDPMSYFRAFHDKEADYSCLGCHLKSNIERKAHGQKPLSVAPCSNNGCHVAAK